MARAGLSRGVVTELALAIIDEGGPGALDSLTLASVAARAGVAMPSLYKHVGSLDDLRREVALASVREFTAVTTEATIGRSGADAVRAYAAAARDFALRRPARYIAAQRAADPDDPADAELASVGGEAVTVVAALLRAFPLPAERHIDAIRAIRSAIHGFVSLELTEGFRLPDDADASFSTLVELVVRGLDDRALWGLQQFGDRAGNVRGHIAAE